MDELETVRKNDLFRCVRVGRRYYNVAYDPVTGKTWGFVRADRRLGEYCVTDIPFGKDAIERVARGRKKHTAIVYFNEHMRKIKRLAAAEKQQPKVLCTWCDGTGQDPRNAEWACSHCS